MCSLAEFVDVAREQGRRMFDGVVTRDNLHLAPELLRPGAARRGRRAIAGLEAYLRRLLLAIALRMEHMLGSEPAARPVRPGKRAARIGAARLRILHSDRPLPDFAALDRVHRWQPPTARGAPVPAAPLLARLVQLQALLDAPERRARRLAWHLARRRSGALFPPAPGTRMPARFGPEPPALFAALANMIARASQARPAPRGPAPRPPPRIRRI